MCWDAYRYAWHSLEEAVALWRVTSQNELFRFLGVTFFRHFLCLRTLGFWLWRFFAPSFATVSGKAPYASGYWTASQPSAA